LVVDTPEGDLGAYNVDTGILRALLPVGYHVDFHALFAPDSRTVAARTDADRVRIWDIATGLERAPLPLNAADSRALGFSPDGQSLIAATHNVATPRLEFWDPATGSLRRTVEFAGCFDFSSMSGLAPIRNMAPDEDSAMLTADGRIVLAARPVPSVPAWLPGWLRSWLGISFDSVYDPPYRLVSVWEVGSARRLCQFRLERDGSRFSPDARFVAAFGPRSGSIHRSLVSNPDEFTVEIWDLPPGRSTASYLAWAAVLGLFAILLFWRWLPGWAARRAAIHAVKG
jgi:WD40 repeat protein